jgi:hypothetical protein
MSRMLPERQLRGCRAKCVKTALDRDRNLAILLFRMSDAPSASSSNV